ncbi:hypothetical protein MMPV_002505 [Pyropia vietnamensis]
MRAWPATAACVAAAATAVAISEAADFSPTAVAGAAAAAAVGPLAYVLPATVQALAGKEITTSSVCITQSDLDQLSHHTAKAMASIGVPPPLRLRWIHLMSVRMPAELGMADPESPAGDDLDNVPRFHGGRGVGGGDDEHHGSIVRDRSANNDETGGGGGLLQAEGSVGPSDASDDLRCYVPEDTIEFIVSGFSTILDEAGVFANEAAETATVKAPSSVVRIGGVCRSCCALYAIDARFLKVIRRCACRRCQCKYDCR